MLKTCLSSGSISSTAMGFSISSHSGYLNRSRSHSINLDSLLSCIIVSLSFFRELAPIGYSSSCRSCHLLRHLLGVFHPRHEGIKKLSIKTGSSTPGKVSRTSTQSLVTSTQRGTHLCMRV